MKIFYLNMMMFISFSSFSQSEKTVLFIGNSYIYYNNLPDLISQISASKGNEFSYESYTPGGASLSDHASNTIIDDLLETQEWDYVVLQEQSQKPSFSSNQVETEVYPYANILCDKISINHDCTLPVFFMTWGRENGDQSNCKNYPPLCTYEGMQTRLIESYTEMAETNQAILSPVGIAWQNIRQDFPEINLYASDGSHPSLNGSYLAACVFYSLFFEDNPIGAFAPETLSSELVNQLQAAAMNSVTDQTTSFNTSAQAIASFEIIGNELFLHNNSLNEDYIQWIGLPEGFPINQQDLTISLGEFEGNTVEIELHAFDNCFQSEFIIEINNLELQNVEKNTFVYPNPSEGALKFNSILYNNASLSVYNSIGTCVFEETNFIYHSFNLSHLPSGTYTMIIHNETGLRKEVIWTKKN